jgi:ATP-binding cassette subfamily C (CFTR/MRP) protein 1
MEELEPSAVNHDIHDNRSPTAVEISNGNFQWAPVSESGQTMPLTLGDIQLKVPRGKLVAIVGAVGSGKSSLLASILGDIPKISGSVTIKGSVAFVSQDPWIQNSKLQDNITLASLQYEFSQEKYEETIRVCQLTRDIEILPSGDQTEIGEKGINLSGGQKQRVALARAVYKDADVYLLDDCLSAVDAQVCQHMIEVSTNIAIRLEKVSLKTVLLESLKIRLEYL